MMKHGVRRISDLLLRKRMAVLYYGLDNPQNRASQEVGIKDFEAAVCYIEPRKLKPDIIRFVSCKAQVMGEQLHIGGFAGGSAYKDAALGRRTCPDCQDPKVPHAGHVHEHGRLVGTCKDCGKPVDYLLTSVKPYFYYFDKPGSKLVISHGSREMHLADELKQALLFTTDAGGLQLPKVVGTAGHKLAIPAAMPVVVNKVLSGTQGQIKYDFWNVSCNVRDM